MIHLYPLAISLLKNGTKIVLAQNSCVGEKINNGVRIVLRSVLVENAVLIKGNPKARVFCEEHIIAAACVRTSTFGNNM